jgi:hypothetical protein
MSINQYILCGLQWEFVLEKLPLEFQISLIAGKILKKKKKRKKEKEAQRKQTDTEKFSDTGIF